MDLVTYALCKKLAKGGGSGLPNVTSADNGKVLKVVNGAWGAENNIHWLDGARSYQMFTSAVLNAFQGALTVALQNNYTSYTMQTALDSAGTASAIDFVTDVNTAFSNNELPVFTIIGTPGFQDSYLFVNTISISSEGVSNGFDALLEIPITYYVQGIGYIYGTGEITVFYRGSAAILFVKIDLLVDGAHS